MSLYDKIIALYPQLTDEDFALPMGTIMLQDNSNDEGAYIAQWNHPTLTQPTQEQLDEI